MQHHQKKFQDSFWEELTITPDKEEQCYYLHKSIHLKELTQEIELYLQCSRPYPNSYHRLTYQLIIDHFSTLWRKALQHLLEKGVATSIEQLKEAFHPQSITLVETINSQQLSWELELLSLQDLISSLVVEFVNDSPIHHYIHA